MGLGGLVEAWSKYGIQTMVLLSLVLQLLLFALPIVRRHKMLEKRAHPARLFKLLLWLAYQLADTTAIYVLGHMAISSSSPSGEVMSLWAALLLVHLGGQDTMTAYSLEDNRLWKRHLLTLVVQAAGVVYVLPGHGGGGGGRSSGSYPRLRAAAALMFVVGFLKFVERILVLRSSDMIKLFDSNRRAYEGKDNGQQGQDYTAPPGQDSSEHAEEDLKQAHGLLSFCMFQFVDYNKFNLSSYQKSVIKHYATKKRLFELVHLQLSLMHDLLYTKAAAIHTWYGCLVRVFSWLVAVITCMLLFLSGTGSSTDGVSRRLDVAVTYALLVGALVLETASSLKAAGSTWTYEILRSGGWDGLGRVVLGFRRLVRAAERSRRRCPSYIGGLSSTVFCVDRVWWSAFGRKDPNTSLVVDQIEEMVTEITEDINLNMDQKEKLMNSRGGLSLDRLLLSSGDEGTLTQELEQLEFDEYLVLWYYATMEFNDPLPYCSLSSCIRYLSTYMMYLFKKQPHMLPPPVRQKTCPNLSKEDRGKNNGVYQKLMEELLIGDAQKKLKDLLGVWVQMLCYAASHCNRESHARELSSGSPEFATVLWVLRAALIKANTPDANIPEPPVCSDPNCMGHRWYYRLWLTWF